VEAREAEHHPARSTSVPRRPHAEITVAPQHPCGSVRSREGRARDGRHTSFVQAFEVQENLTVSLQAKTEESHANKFMRKQTQKHNTIKSYEDSVW